MVVCEFRMNTTGHKPSYLYSTSHLLMQALFLLIVQVEQVTLSGLDAEFDAL